MRFAPVKVSSRAFTLIELLVVMAVIGILAALLLPAVNQGRARAKRLTCISHLRQAGVAFQSFAHDHNGQFPMAVPGSAGGSEEFAASSSQLTGDFFFSFRHFQVLSNELVTPRLLICPADTRLPAPGFAAFENSNLSYFVGLKADYLHPNSILAGDRNVTNDLVGTSTLIRFQSSRGWRWTAELHQFKGNLLFADSHVDERNTPALVSSFDQGLPVAELALPTIPGIGVRNPVSPALTSPGVSGMGSVAAAQTGNPTPKAAVLNSIAANPVGFNPGFTPADAQSNTNLTTQANPTQTPNPAGEKPDLQPEPGFSFFPPVIGATINHALSKSVWLLYLLLLVLAGIALACWLRSAAQGRPAHKPEPPGRNEA